MAVVYPDIWKISAELEKLDSSHVTVPAADNSHPLSPLGLGFLLLGSDTRKKYEQSLSPKTMEKTPNWGFGMGWAGAAKEDR